MKFPFLNSPDTGKPDEFVTLTVLVTLSVIVRFLLDGITLKLFGQVITFSKMDASVYVGLLAPIWASHSYVKVKIKDNVE